MAVAYQFPYFSSVERPKLSTILELVTEDYITSRSGNSSFINKPLKITDDTKCILGVHYDVIMRNVIGLIYSTYGSQANHIQLFRYRSHIVFAINEGDHILFKLS